MGWWGGAVGWLAGVLRVWPGWVERDTESDLDVPAGDFDLLDEQPEQLLFLYVVELVDDLADLGGEVGDSAPELVPAGQRAALVGKAGAFGLQISLAGGHVAGAALEFGQVDETGLVD